MLKKDQSEKLIPIRFELFALKQWAKINVQRNFTLASLRSLLARKFDSNFEHLPMKAFLVLSKQGKMLKM